jgi:hypothetical protein
MLSASTPGPPPATSTLRADGSTTPDSIGFAPGSEIGLPRLKSSTTAASPSVPSTRCSRSTMKSSPSTIPMLWRRPREVRQRRRIEQHQHAAAGAEIARDLVELREEEVVLRPRDDDELGLRRERPIEQRMVRHRPVLRLERAREPPVARGVATRLAFAVPGREDDPPRLAAQRAQDAARELILGQRERDGAPALVLDRGAAVLRHAEAACALGIPIQVVELEVDAWVRRPYPLEQLGMLLARAAPEEDRDVERRGHLGEELARDRRERERPRRRQVEAPARPLGDDLEEREPGQQEHDLQRELRPAARRAPEPHQRTPRQRRASSAKNVRARNASVKSTR